MTRDEMLKEFARELGVIQAVMQGPTIDLEQLCLFSGVLHDRGRQLAEIAASRPDDVDVHALGEAFVDTLVQAHEMYQTMAAKEVRDNTIH
ncbi:hypothetical protein [Paraburkholderia sp. C35]|uniref:hypothetical protein n=1 Tax=Paraburkholderia sp. C35 TaxID=2126993 RepID=UPI000D6921B6|nr:hypothetical protein [Paraburkholderia sp. C35]